MYFREKQSVSAIARMTSLSRNTIKKWLRAGGGSADCTRSALRWKAAAQVGQALSARPWQCS
jgi:transposase-like protein